MSCCGCILVMNNYTEGKEHVCIDHLIMACKETSDAKGEFRIVMVELTQSA